MTQDWERVDESPSRLRWAAMALAAILVVGLLVRPPADESPEGLLDVVEASETAQPTERPTPPPTLPSDDTSSPEAVARAALPGFWIEGAGQPGLAQSWPAVAWDGDSHLYVIGGQTWTADGGIASFHDAAWRYDIDDDAWTALPSPPLDPRTGAAAAWTGTELIMWGGLGRAQLYADGAAFDPVRGTWRRLADGPLSARQGAVAVHTSEGLLVTAGADHAGSLTDGALYNAVADRWTSIPDLPALGFHGMFSATVAGGDEAVIWLSEQWGPDQVAAMKFSGGTWTPTSLPDDESFEGALWGLTEVPGHGVLGLNANPDGGMSATLLRLPYGAQAWAPVSETALPHPAGVAAVAVQQRYYVALSGDGQVHAYDLDHDRWLDVHPVPRSDVYGRPLFPVDDGFIVLVTPTEPDGEAQVLRFVIGGEPLTPSEVASDAAALATPEPDITPRP